MNDMAKHLLGLMVVVSLAASLWGCAVGPNYRPPITDVPAAWTGVTGKAASQPSVSTAGPARLAMWWRTFNDPELTQLVEEALATNLDVQLAEARLRQARAARGVAVGGLWPFVNGSASYDRVHSSANVGAGSGSSDGDQNLYQAGFDALWELDIFGGLRRNVESASAVVQAAQEGLRDAQVSLAAEVALNYIQLRGFQQQLVVAQENLKNQQHTASITRQKLRAGFVGTLDVANADAQVATTESQIPVLQVSAQQTIYALSVLLAQPPAYLLKELSKTQPLPVTPPEVPVGLPSELLQRRPDIREAEAQLHAATAQIGVATADLFPKFSLTGNVSWQSNLLHNWLTDPSRSSSFGPSADWAIFQGGSIMANIREQRALRDQALIAYRKTVLTAFQDVENALFAYGKEWEHRRALNDAVVASRKAVAVSMQLYSAGQTDFLNVLQAQASLYASQNAFVQSNSSACQDLIALYKALGGGWEIVPSGVTATVTNSAKQSGSE
jgi:outer membrane protein, multidrug efflux system